MDSYDNKIKLLTNIDKIGTEKAKKILNWKPKINFIYDIKKTFENMKDKK